MRSGSHSLCIASLASSALLTGCFLIPAEEADEDTRAGFHDVTLNWQLKNLDGSPMAACPAGYTKMVTRLYVAGYVEPPDAIFRDPCVPRGTMTKPVATEGKVLAEETRDDAVRGYYNYTGMKDIWIQFTEETESRDIANTFNRHFEKLDRDETIDFDVYPEGGVPVVAWELFSKTTTAPLATCAAAGVDTIEYASRLYSDTTAPLVVAGSWPCDQHDEMFYLDPDGNSTLIGDGAYQLGSGHTKVAFAPETYFVELRAKRNGVVVGRSTTASFQAEAGNVPHRVLHPEITIDDR